MAHFAVHAADIDAAGLDFAAPIPVAWLDAELADAGAKGLEEGRLVTRLSRSGASDIVVRGRVRARVSTPCARCLEPATVPVDAELSLLLVPAPPAPPARPAPKAEAARPADTAAFWRPALVPGARPAGSKPARPEPAKAKEPEYEITAEDADTDTYDGETVVLDGFVREAILLELPSFPLCSEDCPGIGPAPAEPEPAPDPRLAPLRALRAKLAAPSPKRPSPARPKRTKNQKPNKE